MATVYYRELAGGAHLALFHHESELLRGNPLGDPAVREHPVLVTGRPSRELPLVLILVGFTGFGRRVLNESMWQENLPERLARLTAEGRLPPAVYLWPSCETRYGGSQYMDSPGTGPYERFLRDELVPAVEAAYACGGPGRRLVAGKSSGGYGALTLAMRNPGWVEGVACHAGDMGFDFGYLRDFPDALTCWRRHGGPAAFVAALPGLESIGNEEHHGIDVIAMASCYSPDPEAPLGCALPVDPETGELRPAVWERWLEHDPLRLVERPEHAAALRRLRVLWLDAGEGDEFALQWGLRRLLQRLRALEVPHEAEFFPGGHFGMDHRYERSLPRLLAALD